MRKKLKKKSVLKVNKPNVKNFDWTPIYMKFPNESFAALQKMEIETGKTRTQIFSDYVTEQRQYEPKLEAFIESERKRLKLSSRRAAVSALLSQVLKYLDRLSRGASEGE